MRRETTEQVEIDSTEALAKSEGHEQMRVSVSTNDRSEKPPWIDSTDPKQHSVYGVDNRDDLMANCYAHLRSALSSIEELAMHPGASPTDTYCYDQASGCIWVAVVALAQCGPDAVAPEGY
jgi:hypothetical protein